jgi:ATP phosphoribosyltransferase
MLRIAVQKSGRLSEDSLQLLKECGINFSNYGRSLGYSLKTSATNFPLELLFLRDDDIPRYVADGTADLGIVGLNILIEEGAEVDKVISLGFAKCRLALAVPRESNYRALEDLTGLKIATSFPKSLSRFLDSLSISAQIHEISGSVEVAPSIGLADAICDLVSSGSTLITNGLREIYTVHESEAYLIASSKLKDSEQKIGLVDRLTFRFKAVLNARSMRYVMLNAPKDNLEAILTLLPSAKSPTVFPLADDSWVAIHSLIEESKFWNILEGLKNFGAEGILVVPIEKIIS